MKRNAVFLGICMLVGAAACNQLAGFTEGLPYECRLKDDCPASDNPCHALVDCVDRACVYDDTVNGVAPCELNGHKGLCKIGAQQCDANGTPVGECQMVTAPEDKPEVCDPEGIDENCNGRVNESGDNCACGDNIVSVDVEECDDQNLVDDDGCSATCKRERAEMLAASDTHTCAIVTGGKVKCWGMNANGRLGLGKASSITIGDGKNEMGQYLPFVALGAGKATKISSHGGFTCVVFEDGSLKCFGDNEHATIGVGNTADVGDDPNEMGNKLATVDLGDALKAKDVAAGTWHACAILTGGSVKCWGSNDHGVLGINAASGLVIGDSAAEMGNALQPVDVTEGEGAGAIATSHSHTCVILQTSEKVKCWGNNNNGQLGFDTMMQNWGDSTNEIGSAGHASVSLAGKAKAITAGLYFGCALLENGMVSCWGVNSKGQLGLGDTMPRGTTSETLPFVDLGGGMIATAITSGRYHTCALLEDKTVKCWGDNASGQLGNGTRMPLGDEPNEMGNKLFRVPLPNKVLAISAGALHTCAILEDYRVACWGNNASGQLGLGDTNNRGDDPDEMGDKLPTVKLYSATW